MTRRRDEGFADAPALGVADRYVLQVGLVAGQPPRDRHRLREVGVHPSGAWVHHARQLVGVGGLELGQGAVVENEARERIVEGQLLEDVFVGGRLSARRLLQHRQLVLLEQHLLDLLGRVEIEGLAGNLLGALLDVQHAMPQLLALLVQQDASISTPTRSMSKSTCVTGISILS